MEFRGERSTIHYSGQINERLPVNVVVVGVCLSHSQDSVCSAVVSRPPTHRLCMTNSHYANK